MGCLLDAIGGEVGIPTCGIDVVLPQPPQIVTPAAAIIKNGLTAI